jgi:hypothetical protein
MSDFEANTLLSQAKSLFKEKKFDEALKFYSDATEMMVKQYGEFALPCANFYYLYGGALYDHYVEVLY